MKAMGRFTKIILLLAVVVFTGCMVFNQAEEVVAQNKKEATPVIDPDDPTSIIYLDTRGKLAGTGDPTKPASEAYKAGMGWHPQALAAQGLPKDKYGLVDWAKVVKDGLIKPRGTLDPDAEEMPPLDMDIIIPAKGRFVNDVKYPHWIHTYWLKCEVCHPKIFVPAKGQNNMSMVGIVNGEWCGRCHGKVAFPLTDCNRCHTEPKQSSNK